MQDTIITELETNLSFEAKIDSTPEVKQNFSTVYVDEKEVRRPTVAEVNGLLEIKLSNPDSHVSDFIKKWNASRKRIDLMVETESRMYLMKGCSVKKFDTPKKAFTVFYNTFKEA